MNTPDPVRVAKIRADMRAELIRYMRLEVVAERADRLLAAAGDELWDAFEGDMGWGE